MIKTELFNHEEIYYCETSADAAHWKQFLGQGFTPSAAAVPVRQWFAVRAKPGRRYVPALELVGVAPQSRILTDYDGGFRVVWHETMCAPSFTSRGAAEAYRDALRAGTRRPEYPLDLETLIAAIEDMR